APVVRGRKGEYRKELQDYFRQGYLRARVDGAWVELEEPPSLARYKRHDIEIVVDRLTIDAPSASRLAEALETALRLGNGLASACAGEAAERLLSQGAACPKCGTSVDPPAPRLFSFNSPYGACKVCDGLGTQLKVDPRLVVPDESLSIEQGAITAWGDASGTWYGGTLRALARHFGFSLKTPWKRLPARTRKLLLYGSDAEKIRFEYRTQKGSSFVHRGTFEGVIHNLERRYRETGSEQVREKIGSLMNLTPCPACGGARLRPESLAVRVDGLNIAEWSALQVEEARERGARLRFAAAQAPIADPILKELRGRLSFLVDVGLGYLTLDRPAATLAGGEAQRIRLATQIGSQLTGVLYILDEPSIGLHHRDNRKLLETLLRLRDLGNTVVVVEHDRDTIEAADWVLDLGPGAGRHGGALVAQGTAASLAAQPASLTGRYLSGAAAIAVP